MTIVFAGTGDQLKSMETRLSRSERLADGFIHIIGLSASIAAVTILLIAAVPRLPVHSSISLAIYGGALVAMFAFSAAYHLLPVNEWKGRLRRLDQAAIFVKIAGTYTPFAWLLGGILGFGLLASVWVAAILGVLYKVRASNPGYRMSIAFYLALGWASLILVGPLMSALAVTPLVLLVAGGSLYSFGVVFFAWQKLPYQTAIWHLFVLGGAVCHYFAVVTSVVIV